MSRTYHHSKDAGYEYWASRLHRHGEQPGRATKVATHRKERRVGAKRHIAEDRKACE